MTYRWRDGEVESVVEYAPYVMREDSHIVELPLDADKCGTHAGYLRHRRRGQVACDRCKAAAAASTAAQRAKVKPEFREAQ